MKRQNIKQQVLGTLTQPNSPATFLSKNNSAVCFIQTICGLQSWECPNKKSLSKKIAKWSPNFWGPILIRDKLPTLESASNLQLAGSRSWEDFWTTELRELGDAEVVELACGLREVGSQLMGLAYLVGCDCSWLDFLVHSLPPPKKGENSGPLERIMWNFYILM